MSRIEIRMSIIEQNTRKLLKSSKKFAEIWFEYPDHTDLEKIDAARLAGLFCSLIGCIPTPATPDQSEGIARLLMKKRDEIIKEEERLTAQLEEWLEETKESD